MDGSMVRQAADECHRFLAAAVDRDWTARVPGMDWTVAETVSHVSATLLWYSTDFCSGPSEVSTMDMRVRADCPPADLVATLRAFSTVLVRVLDGAEPGALGFHPFGVADRSGFAAMACDELLVHTADAGRGLGLEFRPSPDLSEATVRRLFPWAPNGTEPWRTLLWANGREDLPGLERQTGWRWHCAPLDTWDGTNPRVVHPLREEPPSIP
jgi:uncharacterized protein (TIGR03083 family)